MVILGYFAIGAKVVVLGTDMILRNARKWLSARYFLNTDKIYSEMHKAFNA